MGNGRTGPRLRLGLTLLSGWMKGIAKLVRLFRARTQPVESRERDTQQSRSASQDGGVDWQRSCGKGIVMKIQKKRHRDAE